MQQTLKQSVSLSGIGLHSAAATNVTLHPAPTDHGIIFERTDITDKDNIIPALWHNVVDTRLCTVISNDSGVRVATIEHLMAALRGCGIDNAFIQIDNAEMPIMDGSAQPFIEAIDKAGIETQSAPRRAIRVLKEITVNDGDKEITLSPASIPSYAGTLVYDNPTIGTQKFELSLVNGNFRHDIADCRTFCLKQDVDSMRANGLALGGSLDNAVVIDDQGVMNPDGLRVDNEMVRHKILDAVGDLALAGGLILGRYEGTKIGHDMNNKILHALFADNSAWEYTDLYIDFADESMVAYQDNHIDHETKAVQAQL